jgi:hypothetical protein
MALGKIKADTLEHSTSGSVDTKFVVEGSAKAWCGASATDGSGISDSLNVSSQTDNGTGDYDYTITSAFLAQMDNGGMTGMAGQGSRIIRVGSTDTTTTLFDSKTHNTADSAIDTSHYWAVHGDLA